jgi:hypothetical protein
LKREFPVFGFVEDHLVIGIIDQIAYREDEPSGPLPMDAFITIIKKRNLVISDVKTRVNASLPNSRQSRPAELQLSLYHQLISDMVNGAVDVGRVYTGLSLDGDTPFTDGFLAEAAQSYSTAGVIAFDTLLENNSLNVSLPKLSLIAETMEHRFKGTIPFARPVEQKDGHRMSTANESDIRCTIIKLQNVSSV